MSFGYMLCMVRHHVLAMHADPAQCLEFHGQILPDFMLTACTAASISRSTSRSEPHAAREGAQRGHQPPTAK